MRPQHSATSLWVSSHPFVYWTFQANAVDIDGLAPIVTLLMSTDPAGIRVVARVRPQHKNELEKDIIVSTAANDSGATVKIPNPKKESETYAFQFSGAYDQTATQQEIYEHESKRLSISRLPLNGAEMTPQFHLRSKVCSTALMSRYLHTGVPERGRHTQCEGVNPWPIAA